MASTLKTIKAIEFPAGVTLRHIPGTTQLEIQGGTLDISASSTAILADGSVPLTSNWDVGAFTITGTQFVSDIAGGTAPLVVTSTTVVTNLNADQVDGLDASAFLLAEALATIDESTDESDSEILRLTSSRTTILADDTVFLTFSQPTSDATLEEVGRLTSVILDVTDTAESGALDVTVPFGGVAHRVLRLASATPGTVFNPDAQDINFVLVSPGLANAFEMDAGRDAFGFGNGASSNSFILVEGGAVSRAHATAQGYLMDFDADVFTDSGNTILAHHHAIYIGQPTIASTAATGTTSAATLYIANAPVSSGGSITNPYALHVDAGETRLDGSVGLFGDIGTAVVNVTGGGITMNPSQDTVPFQYSGASIVNLFHIDADFDAFGFGSVHREGSLITMAPGIRNRTHVTGQGFGIDVQLDTAIHGGAGLAHHHLVYIGRPTISTATATGTTSAASLYIENAPGITGGGSITNPYALHVDDGATRLDGGIDAGLTINDSGLTVTDGPSSMTDDTAVTTAPLVLTNITTGTSWNALDLAGDDTGVGVGDEPVYMRFMSPDDGGTLTEMVRVMASWTDPAAASKDAEFRVDLWQANSFVEAFTVNSSSGFDVFGFFGNNGIVATMTQTDSTAEATLAADTVTSIAAPVHGTVAATDAASVGVTGGANGWDSSGNFDAAVADINEAIAVANECKVELNLNTTWATEMDLDFEALIVDVRDLKSFVNSIVDALQGHGILA